MYVYANTGVHVHVRRGRWLRGTPSVRPLPAISYRRDVTDFTGRRANEKLLGCEVARGHGLYPPSFLPLRTVVPHRPSRHPRTPSPGWQSLLSDIPTASQLPRASSIRLEKYRSPLSQVRNYRLARGRDLRVNYYAIAMRARFCGIFPLLPAKH